MNIDILLYAKGFPCGSAGKESACNVGNLGSITVQGTEIPQAIQLSHKNKKMFKRNQILKNLLWSTTSHKKEHNRNQNLYQSPLKQ